MTDNTLRVINALPCTRGELPEKLGVDDRTARDLIRRARREGVPIVGGKVYRLAANEAEIDKVCNGYYSRIKDMAITVAKLKKNMPVDGQITLSFQADESLR